MGRKEMPSRATRFVLGLVVCLLAGYVAAYYFCVRQNPNSGMAWHAKFTSDIKPEYRYVGSSGRFLFAPIHAFDRIVRSDTWRNESREIERSLGVEYE